MSLVSEMTFEVSSLASIVRVDNELTTYLTPISRPIRRQSV